MRPVQRGLPRLRPVADRRRSRRRGNSKLATSSSLAEIGGPGLAGALVQLFSAPFAILVDAVSFAASAISLVLIRTPEPRRPPRTTATAIRHEIVEGLALVRRRPVLFQIVVRSMVAHVAGSFYGVLYTIYLIDELHLPPLVLGVVVSRQRRRIAGRLAVRLAGHPRPGTRPGVGLDGRRRLGTRHPHAARRGADPARDDHGPDPEAFGDGPPDDRGGR